MSVIVEPRFTKWDIYRVFSWLGIFFVVDIGLDFIIVRFDLMEYRLIPEPLIPGSVWDIVNIVRATGWSIQNNWWVVVIFILAAVIATLGAKYIFKGK